MQVLSNNNHVSIFLQWKSLSCLIIRKVYMYWYMNVQCEVLDYVVASDVHSSFVLFFMIIYLSTIDEPICMSRKTEVFADLLVIYRELQGRTIAVL
jgi:hypothetical protein